MAVESINALFKQALTTALESKGYTVYPNILDRHTGVRTKSKEYLELGRGVVRDSVEITNDCIQGEMELQLKYYKPMPWVMNNDDKDLEFEDCCIQIEKAISQVKTEGMFTRPNMSVEEPATPHNRGLIRLWTLSSTVASRQDRGEVAGPPVNTASPVVSGNEFVGQTLTTTNGTFTGSEPITYSYQWQTDQGTATWIDITGEIATTYTVEAGREGENIRCVVTATNAFGSDSANSNSILIDTLAAPVNTVAPAVTPAPPTEGDLLTSTDGTWTGNPTPTFTYQWYKDTLLIGGATSSTYQTVVGDAGSDFYCEVTATNLAASVSADSNIVTAASSGITEIPVIGDFNWCRDLTLNAYSASPTLNGRRTSDNNQLNYGFAGGSFLFDTATWSTHTSAGADPSYAATAYDQTGNNNHATQATAANQPLINSNGDITFDGAGDKLEIPISLTSSTGFTFAVVWEGGLQGTFDSLLTTTVTSNRFNINFRDDGRVVGLIEGVNSFIVAAGSNLFDGNKHLFTGRYNVTTGWDIRIDNVAPTLSLNTGVAFSSTASTVYWMDDSNGGTASAGNSNFLFMDDSEPTAQNITDLYDWVVNDRGLLA